MESRLQPAARTKTHDARFGRLKPGLHTLQRTFVGSRGRSPHRSKGKLFCRLSKTAFHFFTRVSYFFRRCSLNPSQLAEPKPIRSTGLRKFIWNQTKTGTQRKFRSRERNSFVIGRAQSSL